jgi:hypothetical protein
MMPFYVVALSCLGKIKCSMMLFMVCWRSRRRRSLGQGRLRCRPSDAIEGYVLRRDRTTEGEH